MKQMYIAALLLPWILTAGMVYAGNAPTAEIESYIEKKMKEYRIQGISASIVEGNEVILAKGFGKSDKKNTISADENTLFPIGSITKLFTATAVMQLEEQGRIELDSPISAYMPDFGIKTRNPGTPVPTVRQLLTHHSGLPTNILCGFQEEAPGKENYRDLPALLQQEYMVSEPDTAFAYCNIGYALLGVIIENVSGMSYSDYITKHIFRPLKMDDTAASLPVSIDGRFTKGYEGRKEIEPYPVRDISAGTILSTGKDMSRFMLMVLGHGSLGNKTIIRKETFETMITRQNSNIALDRDFSIGLGYWLIDPIGFSGERLASHGGDLPPFHSVMITMPDAGIGVYLSANTSSANGTIIQMASDIVKMMYTEKTGKPVEEVPLPEETLLEEAAAAGLAGYYVTPMGLMEVRKKGKRMQAVLSGLPLDMIYHGEDLFTLQFRLLGLIPIKADMLSIIRLNKFTYEDSPYIQISAAGVSAGVGEKFEPVPIPDSWAERTGKYEILNPLPKGARDKVKKIKIRHDKKNRLLLFSFEFVGQKISIPLKAENDHQAVTAGIGACLGDTITVEEEGGKEIIKWSGFSLQRKG